MKARLPLIFLLFTILLAVIVIQASAEQRIARPAIEVPEGEQLFVGNYPVKIYVYPEACEVTNVETMTLRCPSQCPKTQEIIRAIYGALRDFHHVITRFIDEYPEYRKLALIYFVNASTLDEADIVVGVIGVSPPKTLEARGYILSGPTKPWRIYITCDESVTEADFTTTFMHELLHALGLNHAKQPFTDDGGWELMYPAGERNITIYPSTLDLYALYMVHFENASGGVVTLPDGMPYIQVQPYYIQLAELESLRKKNEELRAAANENVILRDKLNWTQRLLNNYIKSYDALRSKYVQLARNCSSLFMVCNQTINGLTAKLANMTTRYNQCANQFNRLYEEHQALVKDYDDLAGRFTFLAVTYFAFVAILGGGALWVSLAYGRLRDKYSELLEKLEGGGKQDE